MKYFLAKFQELRKDKVFSWCTRSVLLILAFSFFILFFYWSRLPPTLPFHYSLPWGEEQLTSPFMLLAALIGITLIYAFNCVIATLLGHSSQLFTRTLILAGTTLVLLMIVSVLQVIFLVT